ncbi:MAG: hypothetical protein AAFO82_12630, partial [Bacteroidota bacterium]
FPLGIFSMVGAIFSVLATQKVYRTVSLLGNRLYRESCVQYKLLKLIVLQEDQYKKTLQSDEPIDNEYQKT